MSRHRRLTTLFRCLPLVLIAALWTSSVFAVSFLDPTARILVRDFVTIGDLVYVAPFAKLESLGQPIEIGNESNIQDNVTVSALSGAVKLGEKVILAHGATVNGPAAIGETGVCPGGEATCPSFVGFNAMVDGAIIEKDAMVQSLSRVAPGVTIPSGRKTLPGKDVESNAEIESKTALVTEADRLFMAGVVEVNTDFAVEYAVLAAEGEEAGEVEEAREIEEAGEVEEAGEIEEIGEIKEAGEGKRMGEIKGSGEGKGSAKRRSNVTGINFDPGNTLFNPTRELPTLNGVPTRDPGFRNRIIGDVRMKDSRKVLKRVMEKEISLRADEGEPFEVGSIVSMASRTVFHALEHTHLRLGDFGYYGVQSIVHGGPTPFANETVTGINVSIGSHSVLFRSRLGDNSSVGFKSLVQQSDLPPGTAVPDRTVIIDNVVFGPVEW